MVQTDFLVGSQHFSPVHFYSKRISDYILFKEMYCHVNVSRIASLQVKAMKDLLWNK